MPEENAGGGDIVVCPTCQKIWPKGIKFCTQCGTWIESGEVMEPGAAPKPSGQPAAGPSPPGISPTQPGATPSPPGAGPKQPVVGPPPPGIGPAQPAPPPPGGGPEQRSIGSAPPSIGSAQAGIGPQAPGPDQMPPGAGAGPGGVPTAPVAAPEDVPPGEPPKKKYSFKVDPQREEHVPSSSTFLPKRDEKKKKKKSPVVQTVLVIVCLLAIAFAVISMAFKPLYHFILGTVFDLIGQEESALDYYSQSADKGNSMAAKALTKLGKKGFGKHLELQYYNDWSAGSSIRIISPSGETSMQSTIAYTAPGKVTETIASGSRQYEHVADENGYRFNIGPASQRASAAEYADQMQASIDMTPAELFAESGKDKALDVLFDDLGMRLLTTKDEDGEKAYVFEADLEGDFPRTRQLAMLVGPFVPWSAVMMGWAQTGRVQFVIRMSDGFLMQVLYHDANGQLVVEQTFSDFKASGS